MEVIEITQRRNEGSNNPNGGQRGKKCWNYEHTLKIELTEFTDELCKILNID